MVNEDIIAGGFAAGVEHVAAPGRPSITHTRPSLYAAQVSFTFQQLFGRTLRASAFEVTL
jgi:hypothetical protein